LAEDLGDRGLDPTVVRASLPLRKLSGENLWSAPSHVNGRASCR
jgi:hypothetical protein